MEQWHQGGDQGVLLQQLDDSAVPVASAAIYAAQLHPLPKVSALFALLIVMFKFSSFFVSCFIFELSTKQNKN